MIELAALTRFITPLTFIFGSLAVGFILEKIILLELKHIAVRSKWRGNKVLVDSLRGTVIFAALLGGFYLSIIYLPFSPYTLVILKKAVLIAAIFLATIITARLSVGFINLYAEGTLPSASIFTNIAKLIIYILGFLVILQTIGVSITPMLTALGVGGLGVALAMQETLSNLFAGIQVIASKQVKAGDFVKLETGQQGYVMDITWRNTTINELPDNTIIVPNTKMASSIITNYSKPKEVMSILVGVGVGYDSDLEMVEKVTLDVAKEVMGDLAEGVSEFSPSMRYHTFGASSIRFSVVMRAHEFTDQYRLKHEFIKRLHKRYADEGIEIPFPIRTIIKKSDRGPTKNAD